MDGFGDIGREHWEDKRSVSSVRGYERCFEYVRDRMPGFSFRLGSRTANLELSHCSISIGRGQIDFVQAYCDGGFRIEKSDEFDYYYLKLVSNGRCKVCMGDETVIVNQSEAAAVNPFGSLSVNWQDICEQVLIRLDRSSLEKTLSKELGIDVVDSIRFAPVAVSNEEYRAASVLVDFLRRNNDEACSLRAWRLDRQFERLLHLAALQCFPNNYSDLLRQNTSMVAPHYVRKCEEYLKAHLGDDVTIDELANLTGVSARSLYHGLRRWRSTTPRALLKKLRLEEARRTLRSAARTGQNVTDVATAVGFFHLSRFSSEYKARFGESPSVTLRRG